VQTAQAPEQALIRTAVVKAAPKKFSLSNYGLGINVILKIVSTKIDVNFGTRHEIPKVNRASSC
jgi:hypothetical protein